MEFFDVIKARRSVRKFTEAPVPPEVINRAIDAALVAPNSSNMQPWEFYWVRSPEKKKALAAAAFSQTAATTAAEIVVAVSRIDRWKRNQKMMMDHLNAQGNPPKMQVDYYTKIVPMAYTYGFFNVIGIVKWLLFAAVGFFRPVPRGPNSKAAVFEVVTKTTALACENLMLSIFAQGYGCCPMEGFDEARVKKLLGLNRKCHVVMLIAIGATNPRGIYGEQLRFDRSLFVHEV